MTTNLKLNKKDKKVLKVSRFIIFIIFVLFFIHFSYRLLFSSEYFTQSFENMNSLKNTITDVSKLDDSISFFASTPQEFSEIKVNIELKNKSRLFENSNLEVKKSFKSFFYPATEASDNYSLLDENTLVASPESIFIVGNEKKIPFDNPMTFTGLGYQWENIEDKKIDLSDFQKGKLLNIASPHPDGTIISTDEGRYYLISEGFKREITSMPMISRVKKYKNNIAVQEKSLDTNENCQFKNNIFFKKRYSCTIPLNEISKFSGKDYQFNLFNLPNDTEIKKIDLEFKKTPSKENLFIFIADIKTKVKARFTGEKL